MLGSLPWHIIAVWLGRHFNLSELLLPHLYNWDNLINLPRTLGGANEIPLERFPVQSAWHIVSFNKLVPLPEYGTLQVWWRAGPTESLGETVALLPFLRKGEFWRQPLTCELSVLTGGTPPARGPWQANRPQSHLRRHFLGSIPVLSPLNPQALYLLSKCWNWKDPQNFSNTQISLWTEEDTQAEGSWDWSWTTKDGGYPGSRSLGS